MLLSSTVQAIGCELWKVRVLGLQLLQVIVYHVNVLIPIFNVLYNIDPQILIFENLFMFEKYCEEITETLLTTMGDVQMEVRNYLV